MFLLLYMYVYMCLSLNKQIFIISHNFWSQESGSGLAGWFWTRVSQEVKEWLQSSHGFTGSQGPTFKMVHHWLNVAHSYGCWLEALHFAFHLTVGLLECLHSKSSSFLLSEQSKREDVTVINMAFRIGYLRFQEPCTTKLLHFFMLLTSITVGDSMDLPRVTQLALTWGTNESTSEDEKGQSWRQEVLFK